MRCWSDHAFGFDWAVLVLFLLYVLHTFVMQLFLEIYIIHVYIIADLLINFILDKFDWIF